MLALIKSTSPPISSRLSRYPVDKLSMTRTRAPWASKVAARGEPMNPAPPVTIAIPDKDMISASYTHVFKSYFANIHRIIDIPEVGNPGSFHGVTNPFHVQSPKLIPLGHESQNIGTSNSLVLICSKFYFR